MKGSRQDWGWGAKFLSENTRRRWKRIEDGETKKIKMIKEEKKREQKCDGGGGCL